LLSPAEQRALLDRFAGAEAADALGAIRDARAAARALDEELAAFGGDERSRAREIDLLRYQLDEIAAAAIAGDDEDAQLESQAGLLADAEAHRDALETARTQLEGPAEDALGAAVAALGGRDPFIAIEQRLRALQSEVAEAAHDVRLVAEGVVADPERLAEVQARRAALKELMRKYGPTLADVVAFAAEADARFAELTGYEDRVAAIVAAREQHEGAARAAAERLSAVRAKAAEPLATRVTAHLRELALPAAEFAIAIEPTELGEDGADEVTFVLAPNPGEPPRPLAKAASGGELSRAMLALRVVLSEAPPTLVFDEVDAGIGGEAGIAVGRALATLGGRHQVLCVTHLAQVATFADAHVSVSKRTRAGRTTASAELLLDDARVGEISRMLAGDGDSSHARRHAKELLAGAAETRRAVRA
jgi:DNA repair protein RecN (Recombination protein N)